MKNSLFKNSLLFSLMFKLKDIFEKKEKTLEIIYKQVPSWRFKFLSITVQVSFTCEANPM